MRNNNRLPSEDTINIHDILNLFYRRKNLFFYISIPVFLGIIIAQFSRPFTPMYRATFDIGVTKERPVEGMFSGEIAETPTIQIGAVTQRAISSLLSVHLARKVVDSLSLYTYIKNGNSDLRVETRIKEEFKNTFGPLKLKIADGGFTIFSDGQKIKEGLLNEFVDLGPFELKIIALKEIPDNKTYELKIYPIDRIALALRNSLSIKVLEADRIEQEVGGTPIPFTGEGLSKKLVNAKTIFPGVNLIGILRIDVHWGDPDEALRIAEVLSKQIVREDVREKSLQFTQSKTFIDSQLTFYQGKLTEFEDQIRGFKEQKKIVDLGASTQALINQISTMESKKNQLQIEQKILDELGSYLAKKEEDIEEIPNFASVLVSSLVLQNFYNQLLQAEAELKGRLKEYSKGHPKVLEISAKLGGLKEQMQEEITKRIPSISREIQSVDNQIQTLQLRLKNVPVDEISLARLERDKETAEKLYTFFAEKLEETRVQEAGVTSDLKIINPPLVSFKPVNSRRPLLTLFLSFIIGILAGGFAVFIAEYVDNTVKDPEMVATKTGLPVFASIPVIEKEKTQEVKIEPVFKSVVSKIKDFLSPEKKVEEKLKLITADISTPEFEAFRKLSMNLDFAHPEKKYQVIYVTSPGPEEGKTFVAMNLGVVFASMSKRVILIDTDFRKKSGHLTDVTKFKKEEGLFDVLKGEAKLQGVTIRLKHENAQNALHPAPDASHVSVDLLPVGKIPPNPFVFLESEKMKELVKELCRTYDYIIIDGVPVLLFADATYLAKFADGVLLTARHGKTDLKELENSKDILLTAKSNIIGLVLNAVPKTRGSYYYRYYHKYYSKYYKKE